ncbi:MAG: hypothetical protein SF002_16175 [Alphaproteobacteria bacterium]|nr:hypothetical protein [Alphaproteobacteria bacterium]
MSRLVTSFVLGYHGCDRATADRIVNQQALMTMSKNDWDWLGSGIYFWEADPDRALEWAAERQQKGKYQEAAVVGAIIDLGNCLDLMSRKSHEFLAKAYSNYKAIHELVLAYTDQSSESHALAKKKLNLANASPSGSKQEDLLLRRLDCAIINWLHDMARNETDEAQKQGRPSRMKSFDTVRGLFIEGSPTFPGSGIMQKTHIQIAVVNPDCIKGVFHWPYPAQA